MDFRGMTNNDNDGRAWPKRTADKRNQNAEYDFYIAFVSRGGTYHIAPTPIKFYVGCGHWVSITEDAASYS
jgi:hypothetical protein